MTARELEILRECWSVRGRYWQVFPGLLNGRVPWRSRPIWLLMGGRGSGKTRAGAEWVRALVRQDPDASAERMSRLALVGETFAAARDVMVEGPAGLLASYARRRSGRSGRRPAPARMAERRRRPCVLGRGSGQPARAAIRGRLGRRARQMAPRRGELGHAAVRAPPGRAAAPARHDDAAADAAAEAAAGRSADRGQPRARRGDNAEQSGAGLPRRRSSAATPARGSAARSSTAKCRGPRPTRSGSASAIEAGRVRPRRRSRRIVVAVDPPASSAQRRRCLRHRRRRHRRGRARLCARRRDAAGPEPADWAARGRRALSPPGGRRARRRDQPGRRHGRERAPRGRSRPCR